MFGLYVYTDDSSSSSVYVNCDCVMCKYHLVLLLYLFVLHYCVFCCVELGYTHVHAYIIVCVLSQGLGCYFLVLLLQSVCD